jgi:hypothetical protein
MPLPDDSSDQAEPGESTWRPRLHAWSRRVALIGIGLVIGVETAGAWAPVALAGVTIATVAAWITMYLADPSSQLTLPPTRAMGRRKAVADASERVRREREAAEAERRAAGEEAKQTLLAARQEAQLLVERARTVAAALDRSPARAPRVPPERPEGRQP